METKQEERFNEAISFDNDFMEDYPNSKYLKDAQNLKKQSEQGIAQAKRIIAAQQPKAENKENKNNIKTTENE